MRKPPPTISKTKTMPAIGAKRSKRLIMGVLMTDASAALLLSSCVMLMSTSLGLGGLMVVTVPAAGGGDGVGGECAGYARETTTCLTSAM